VLWESIIGAANLADLQRFPELRYMPRDEIERWKANYERRVSAPNFNRERALQIAANRKVLLKALADGGVRILFGTDAPQIFSVPGFSVHRELKAMAAAGMSNYEILRSATRNVGEYLGTTDRFGIVAPGHRADLLLLNGDPLTDLGFVGSRAGVMLRGRWFSEPEIQARLEKIVAASNK
jgi:imidazolonepropionase-like amidohydrolase